MEMELDGAFRQLIEKMTVVIFTDLADDDFTPIYISPQIQALVGYSQAEWLADPELWWRSIHPDDLDRVLATANDGLWELPFICEYRLFAKDGRTVWIREETVTIRDSDGVPELYQGVFIDITAQKEAEEALRQVGDKYRHLLDNAYDVIMTFDTAGRLTYVNRAFQYHTGYSAEEAIGMHVLDLVYVEDRLSVAARIDALLRHEKVGWDIPFRVVVRDGGVHWAENSPSVIEENGQVVGIQAIVRDVTVQQVREQQLVHRAYHDSLTGLPNRSQFIERLDQCLRHNERRADSFAVLFIDLDNFKEVNDALGHAAGDRALVIAARRMQDVLREQDIVARFGGDEFAILLTGLDKPSDAEEAAGRLIDALTDPIQIARQAFVLTASIGVALPAGVNDGSEALLRRADMAMYESKLAGKNQFQVYESLVSTRRDAPRRQTDPLAIERLATVRSVTTSPHRTR